MISQLCQRDRLQTRPVSRQAIDACSISSGRQVVQLEATAEADMQQIAAQRVQTASLRQHPADRAERSHTLQAMQLEAKVEAATQQLASQGSNEHWVAFERIVSVLLASGALLDVNVQGMMYATPLGLVARDLQANNPLWLAMALLSPAVQVCPSCAQTQPKPGPGLASCPACCTVVPAGAQPPSSKAAWIALVPHHAMHVHPHGSVRGGAWVCRHMRQETVESYDLRATAPAPGA